MRFVRNLFLYAAKLTYDCLGVRNITKYLCKIFFEKLFFEVLQDLNCGKIFLGTMAAM